MSQKVLIVVPPVTVLNSPNIGAHILQAYSKKNGYQIDILYSDLIFAQTIGKQIYNFINNSLMSPYEQVVERLFAPYAYTNISIELYFQSLSRLKKESKPADEDGEIWDKLNHLPRKIEEWIDNTIRQILEKDPQVVGFTTSHQQTNAAICLINRIKTIKPSILTLIGGSNCDREMGDGIATLSSNIDYVFSGESEISFVEFLTNLNSTVSISEIYTKRVIRSKKLKSLNEIPTLDFQDYFDQLEHSTLNLAKDQIWLNYETSRGCWWGVSNLCTFCGVNGSETSYRLKSAYKVEKDLKHFVNEYAVHNIRMVDTLMPGNYFRSLLSTFKDIGFHNVFYEMRADMTYEQVKLLKEAKINYIQIGIESFSNNILRKINKGATAVQNVKVLRFCRMNNITVGWNLLSEVPGDSIDDWNLTLSVLPYLRHLDPPNGFRPVEIARFSPYFESSMKYQISNISPLPVYSDIFPTGTDLKNIAWLFTGEYHCNSRQNCEIVKKIEHEVEFWNKAWKQAEKPTLEIIYADGSYILIDSRELPGCQKVNKITEKQASVCLLGDKSVFFESFVEWALDKKILLDISSEVVPIILSEEKILERFIEL